MDSFIKLKKWLGIKDSLKIFERNERGIYTTEPIEKNKIIIKIKSKFLLEFQQIYKIYPIDDIEEANSLVAFYLTKLYFDNNQFWLNYINTFPNDLDDFPYYWNDTELNYLKETSFYSSTNINFSKHLETIEQDFEIINQYNLENLIIQNIDYNEFYFIYIKFRFIVGSRIFGYIKYNNETSGMVPYIDLLNHSENNNTIWYWDDLLDSFVLISTRNIRKGEELTDNYGNKNNVELLLYYGFTLHSNPDSILSFNFNNIDYLFNLKYDISKLYQLNKDIKYKLKKKIEKIYFHHTKKIQYIKNINILNIYQDEIKISKLLLSNL